MFLIIKRVFFTFEINIVEAEFYEMLYLTQFLSSTLQVSLVD